jgi:outer membrane lipoprotein-sorting protein
LGTGAVVVTGALSSGSYAVVASVGSVLQSARTAISKEPGVHVSFVVVNSSSVTERISAQAGTSNGTESVSADKASLKVRLTPTEAYISGNSSGLTSIFGMSSAEAKKVGKNWVSWKKSTSQYSDLESNVTVSSVAAILPKTKGTKVSTAVIGHTRSYLLKWKTAATKSSPTLSNTLAVSESTGLPLQETTTDSTGTNVTTTFSKWGESVVVDAPPAGSTIASSRLKT